MTAKLQRVFWNLLFLAGAGFFVYGFWAFWHPGAFLVAGMLLTLVGFLGGLDRARDSWGAEE